LTWISIRRFPLLLEFLRKRSMWFVPCFYSCLVFSWGYVHKWGPSLEVHKIILFSLLVPCQVKDRGSFSTLDDFFFDFCRPQSIPWSILTWTYFAIFGNIGLVLICNICFVFVNIYLMLPKLSSSEPFLTFLSQGNLWSSWSFVMIEFSLT
jgi:hypothetical protein